MNLYCARLLLLRSFICSGTDWGRGVAAAAKIDEAWDEKEMENGGKIRDTGYHYLSTLIHTQQLAIADVYLISISKMV